MQKILLGFGVVLAGLLMMIDRADAWSVHGRQTVYDPTASGLSAYNVQDAIDEIAGGVTPGGGFEMPAHMVLVDSGKPEIAGERYQTWAAADVYVVAQTPSAANVWAIKITGSNAENIVVRPYINIVGVGDATALTGNLTSGYAMAGPGLPPSVIYNCKISALASVTPYGLRAYNCTILGTSGVAYTGGLISSACAFMGGDYSYAIVSIQTNDVIYGGVYGGGGGPFAIDNTTIYGGTFTNTNMANCVVSEIYGTAVTLNGLTAKNSTLNIPSATVNNGDYTITGGSLTAPVVNNAGTSRWELFDVALAGGPINLITDASGPLHHRMTGCSAIAEPFSINLSETGGGCGAAYNSGNTNCAIVSVDTAPVITRGVMYDNTVSGLPGFETNTAIDALAGIAQPKFTVAVAKAGSKFSSIQTAINSITVGAGEKYVVLVYPGIYIENVVLKTGVNLLGVSGGSGAKIASASGTTLDLGSGYSHVQQMEIETTSTTDRAITLSGGLHILTHCKITGAYNAGDHQTTLIQNTNGALYIRAGSNIDIDRAGPGVIRALYTTGTATVYFENSNVNIKSSAVGAADDIIIFDDARTGGTFSISSGCNINATFTGTMPAGDIVFLRSTNPGLETLIRGSYARLLATGGTGNSYIYQLDSGGNSGVIYSGTNSFQSTGFANNYFTDVDTGDAVYSFDSLRLGEVDLVSSATLGAGITEFVTSPKPGDIQLSGTVVQKVIDIAVDYGATENWKFNVMLMDTDTSDKTVTFPADISGFSEGEKRLLFNTGTELLKIEPNGNTVDGSTAARVVYSGGFIQLQKLGGNIRITSSKNINFDIEPDDIANLEVWIEPFDGTTVTKTGDLIDQINDKSGNAHHFTGSGVTRPDINEDGIINGKDSILFTNTELITAGDIEVHNNSVGRGLYVCCVLKPEASGDYPITKYTNAPSNQYEWYMGTSRSRVYDTLTGTYSTGLATLDYGNWQLVEFKWTTGEGIKIYVNGALRATSTVTITDIEDGTADLILGDADGLAGYAGEIGGLVIYSRQLTNAEQQSIRNYFAGRLSMTDIIPVSTQTDLWDRDDVTNTLIPENENDNINVGTGAVRATRLDFVPSTVPSTPATGYCYFDSTSNKLTCWDGTAWQEAW